MDRRPKQTFLQKRHTDGQQTHEDMLHITGYQINANQNCNNVLPHTGQYDHHQKNLQTINAGEVQRKVNTYVLLVGVQIGTATMENSMEVH